MKTFKQFSEGYGGYSYSSTQLNLDDISSSDPLLSTVRELQNRISDDVLAESGKETELHVTVLYGLETHLPESIVRAVGDFRRFDIEFGKVRKFSQTEKGYDVLFVEAKSEELVNLNAQLKTLPHKSTHPTYHPHMTLAYVKPGTGDHLVGNTMMEGMRGLVQRIVFSSKTKGKIGIPLREDAANSANPSAIGLADTESGTNEPGVKKKDQPNTQVARRKDSTQLKECAEGQPAQFQATPQFDDTCFCGDPVFDVPTDTFMKCKAGKGKYDRYSRYFGIDEDPGKAIREHGLKNKVVVLRDEQTKAMLYLKFNK